MSNPIRSLAVTLRISVTACLCLTLGAIVALSAPLAAQTSGGAADSVAVIEVAQRLLHAISTRDTTLARETLLTGAQLASIPDPAGAESAGRIQSDQQFMATLATGTPRYLERMWSPTVFLQGSLAIVRAPYDFHIDGAFSHCGVDVFTMVRSRGAWRITHVVYTTQRQRCEPSPLGAPTS